MNQEKATAKKSHLVALEGAIINVHQLSESLLYIYSAVIIYDLQLRVVLDCLAHCHLLENI